MIKFSSTRTATIQKNNWKKSFLFAEIFNLSSKKPNKKRKIVIKNKDIPALNDA